MQDHPSPSEILGAVARFLKEVVVVETKGATAFQARVAANALEMMRRQLDTAPAAEAAELISLKRLLGADGLEAGGDLEALNAELARRLGSGALDLKTPGMADHLWAVTLAKLAVDQPTYWGYRAALTERASPPPPQDA